MLLFKVLVVLYCIFYGEADIESEGPRLEILEKALNGISSIEKNITDLIPSFHFYTYDGHPYDIHNGGYDMYDGVANKVYHTNEDITDVLYDYNLAYGSYYLGVRSDHPLFGLMWIKNKDKEYHTYRVQIEGYPGYGALREVDSSDGKLQLDGAKLQYKAFQVHGLDTPSICELYFVLENDLWASEGPDDFAVMTYSKSADYLQNAVYMSGKPYNVIMGYMLLSNSDGNQVPSDEIENALRITANSVLKIDSGWRNFTESALLAIEAVTPDIRDSVTGWYNYSYTMQEIENGGEDMYGRRGNRIFFHEDSDTPTKLYYDLPYRGLNYQVFSRPIHPFFGLMWITNPMEEFHEFFWQVTAFAGRNDMGYIFTNYDQQLVFQNIEIQYNVFSLSNVRDHPSICEVYFTAHSKMWDSNANYKVSAWFGNDSENLDNTIVIEGTPKNVLLGYFLLSKKNAARVNESEIQGSLIVIAEELNKITKISENHLEEVANGIEKVSPGITAEINDWHEYSYDEQFYKTSYEKRDMYNPWGNMIIFAEDLDHAKYNRSNYDLYYTYKKAAVKCKVGHPFVALMFIDGSNKFDSYSFKVHSHVKLPRTAKHVYYHGSLSVLGTTVDYFVFQLYNRNVPSVCEVYFTMNNPTNWSSVMLDSYVGSQFDPTTIQDNYIYLLGYIKRVFMGYTLLSQYPGNEAISEDKNRQVLIMIATSVTESFGAEDEFTYCNKEVIQHPNDNDIMLTFPETAPGTLTYSIEACPANTTNYGVPYGSRMCKTNGNWVDPSWIESCDILIETTTVRIETTSAASKMTSNSFFNLLLVIVYSYLQWTLF